MQSERVVTSMSQRLPSAGFMSALSPEAIDAFNAIQITISYPSGTVLFAEGDSARGVFVLATGRAKISIGSAYGKVMILRMAKPGEILGLDSAIRGSRFQSTAQTAEPCQGNFVRREEFLSFVSQYPQAAVEVTRQLSGAYHETCECLRRVGLSTSAPEKLARFLLQWSENGKKLETGIRSRLTLTHEEIGQLTGTSRETITRSLAAFKARQWISINGSMLVVQNEDALRSFVGSEGNSLSSF